MPRTASNADLPMDNESFPPSMQAQTDFPLSPSKIQKPCSTSTSIFPRSIVSHDKQQNGRVRRMNITPPAVGTVSLKPVLRQETQRYLVSFPLNWVFSERIPRERPLNRRSNDFKIIHDLLCTSAASTTFINLSSLSNSCHLRPLWRPTLRVWYMGKYNNLY